MSDGWNSDKERSYRQHYNTEDIDFAFVFMTGVDQISHQASRTHYFKDNKGLLHELPANIRRFNVDESYRLYCLHCCSSQPTQDNINTLSSEKYKEMLNIVAPQSEKNLAALDSVYVKCGIENFEALRELSTFSCGTKSSNYLIQELITRYKEYLKNGLQANLCDDSYCKSHSYLLIHA